MCFYVEIRYDRAELVNHFDIPYEGKKFERGNILNGFAHPVLPAVISEDTSFLMAADWGLIPSWSSDREIQKRTLNAKIETLPERNSFKRVIGNRCLIPVSGFYEWKWLDSKGKQKQQYKIGIPGEEIFCLGGLYNFWEDRETGEELLTFTLVTTQANELMSEIHNIKRRMPVVLNQSSREQWLNNPQIEDFAFPNYDPKLEAVQLDGNYTLF